MKHILIFIGYQNTPHFPNQPHKSFTQLQYAQLNVENILDLGIDPKDIIVGTNFPWEHKGVKATMLHNSYAPAFRSKNSSKIYAAIEIIERGMLEGQLAWLHDLDIFQCRWCDFPEMEGWDLGLRPTDTVPPGWDKSYGGGSFVFRESALPKFQLLASKLGDQSVRIRKGCEEILISDMVKAEEWMPGRDFLSLNRTYGYGFKPSIRQGRGKGDYRHVIDNIQLPLRGVDFNYCPLSHRKFWQKNHWIGDRLKKVLGLL